MIEALVTMNVETNGISGLFLSIGIFFVLLAVLSFADNMETFTAASFLSAVITMILWFNEIVYFPVMLFWVLALMVVAGFRYYKG